MKIIGFSGSPRKNANTDTLVKAILSGAKEKGAEIEFFNITGFKIEGCRGCYYCNKNPLCIIKDDMQKFYGKIKNADAIVIGSPVYMWQMSGQTAIFVNRLYALLGTNRKPKFRKGKPLILAYTQGDTDSTNRAYFLCCGAMFEDLGYSTKEIVVAGDINPFKLKLDKRRDVIKKARKAGRKLSHIAN